MLKRNEVVISHFLDQENNVLYIPSKYKQEYPTLSSDKKVKTDFTLDLNKHDLPIKNIFSIVVNSQQTKLAYSTFPDKPSEKAGIFLYDLKNKNKKKINNKNIPANYIKRFTKNGNFILTGIYRSSKINCIVNITTL